MVLGIQLAPHLALTVLSCHTRGLLRPQERIGSTTARFVAWAQMGSSNAFFNVWDCLAIPLAALPAPSCSLPFLFTFLYFFCPFSSSLPLIFLTILAFTISFSTTLSSFHGRSPAGHAVLRHLRCPPTASLLLDSKRHLKYPPAWTDGGAIRSTSLVSWASAMKSPSVSTPTSPPILLGL